jgi:hypothetical protein
LLPSFICASLSFGGAAGGRAPPPLFDTDDAAGALAAADAGSGEAGLETAPAQLVDERDDHARARVAERVSESGGAAVDVHGLGVETDLACGERGDAGERFVELGKIDVLGGEAGFLQRQLAGHGLAVAHDLGGYACRGVAHQRRDRLAPEFGRLGARRDHERAGAVTDR